MARMLVMESKQLFTKIAMSILIGRYVANPDVGVTSPLAPKVPDGPWLLRIDKAGDRTTLIATLRQPARQPVEFRIHCDRVESKATEVIALGKVTFAGVGLNG